MRKPSLRVPVSLAILAVIFITLSGVSINAVAKGVYGLIFLVFLAGALSAYLSWLVDQYTSNYRLIRKAQVDSREIRLAEVIAGMSPEQMRAYMTYIPTTVFAMDRGSKKKLIRTPWGEIPHEFVIWYLQKGSGDFLYPTNGKDLTMQDQRDFADWLTRLICSNGYAGWWRGHYAARWTDGGFERFVYDFEIDIRLPGDEEEQADEPERDEVTA